MSEENGTPEESEGVKNLRKQYEEQAKALKAAQDELAGFRAERRTGSLAEVLKAKGLDEARAAQAAKLYSGEDVSEAAVGKWLEDFADVFGVTPNQSSQQPGRPDPTTQSVQRISDAQGGPADPITPFKPGEHIPVGDPEKMLHAINTLPYEKLVEMGYFPDVEGTLYDRHGR